MAKFGRIEFIRNVSLMTANLKVGKDHRNEYGGYAYRNAADILAAVKPHLTEFGYDLVINSEIVEISGRFYVKTAVTITDGVNEKTVSAMARETQSRKGMDDSQVTGAATTYSKKYALENLFCIDNNPDADSWTNNQESQKQHRQYDRGPHADYNPDSHVQHQNHQPQTHHRNPQQPTPNAGHEWQQISPQQKAPITPPQVESLRMAMAMAHVSETQLCKKADIQHIGQMTQNRIKAAIAWLQTQN